MDFRDQERIFGSLLGSVPNKRAKTNGVVIYKGYVVAEFGDTTWVDPTYSVAKSMMATVAGIAVRDGRSATSTSRSAASSRTAATTRRATPRSPGRCTCSRRPSGKATCAARRPTSSATRLRRGRAQAARAAAPGSYYEYNDVRINRSALSLLRTFNKPVPEVFREQVMDVIGASNTWKWVPYHNSYVEVDGKQVASVSGGTRWGGGMWINSWDMARFGYLWLRGGKWGEQADPAARLREGGLGPSAHGPDYGYLWWLNTKGKNYPGLPANVYGARGAGSNTMSSRPTTTWSWSGAGTAATRRSS